MSLVMITHDMGIVAEITDRCVVLYAGKICESAPTTELFMHCRHPYTEGLLSAVPRIDAKKELPVIPGSLPNLLHRPSGCVFHPRCKYAERICREKEPIVEKVDQDHFVACHRWKELNLGN